MAQAGTAGFGQENKRQEVINIAVLTVMFIIYALTFVIAKFYDITYPYAGVINFCLLAVLLCNNVSILTALKNRDADFCILTALVILTGINLMIVDSGKGAFFVPVNFLLIWYMSDKLYISERTLKVFAAVYMAYLLFYLFIAYPRLFTTFENYKYNTNTAATFTIYTMLCAFMLPEILTQQAGDTDGKAAGKENPRTLLIGLFKVMILLKGFQLSLWHRARGAFIMLILFMVFKYCIPRKWWKNKIPYVILCLLATLGSLVFVGLYVYIGETGANFKLPFFYKEVFSGREAIWHELFDLLVHNERPYTLFTGIGTNFELTSFFEKNVHNAMYNFVVIHGTVVFAGILYFIYKRLWQARERIADNRVAMTAMCALMAVFFESYLDVDLIWADYALNLIFLLIMIYSPHTSDRTGTTDAGR